MQSSTPVTYAIVRTPRQGAPFALLLAGPYEQVMRRWKQLDVRQGTAELHASHHDGAVIERQSGPNSRSRW